MIEFRASIVIGSPFVISNEICRQHEVELVGEIHAVREHFYAISAERRIKYPAALAISSAAQNDIFA